MADVRALIPEVGEPPVASSQPVRSRRRIAIGAVLAAVGIAALGCAAFSRSRGRTPSTVVARDGVSGEVTELMSDIEKNACDLYPYLKFEVPKAMVYKNLANKGPDHGNGEGLVYKTIDIGAGAGDELDREVILTINATSSNYHPFSPRLNGMQGKYGSVNLNSGSKVDLLFNFYDRKRGSKLTLPEFAITFFDLDTGRNQKSTEYVIIGGFDKYHLTSDSEVAVEKQADGRTKFAGSTYGTGEDNPTDPMFLTDQQKNRAVTLLYGPTSSLDVTIGATPGSGPRFFTFVARPSLLCAVTVQQGFKPPLADLTYELPMQVPIDVGHEEKFVSFAVKKGDTVKEGDVIATTQKDGEAPHQYLAPCDGVVMGLQDKLKPGEKLDLRLSEKTIAVIKRPELTPLPTDGEVADHPAGVVGGGPGPDAVEKDDVFKKYLVEVGDGVSTGDDIALVEADGEEKKVKALADGTVKARQEDMQEGMLLGVVPDGNLISIAPFKALGPLGDDNKAAAVVPVDKGYTFEEFHVKKGDIVKKGDPIATVKDESGNEKVITASHGGVVSALQDGLEKGTPVARVEDGNLCTTGKFAPLPLGPGEAPVSMTGASGTPSPAETPAPGSAEADSEEAKHIPDATPEDEDPLHRQDEINPNGLKFEKYYVKPGDTVQTGDPIAQVEDADGNKHDVLAPRPGVVTHVQDGLQKGMILDEVMVDDNLASLDRLPVLDLEAKDKEGAFAPSGSNWKFKEWKVDVGDNVKEGDPIAVIEDPVTLQDKEVLASKSGTVTEKLKELQPGDDIEEVTKDDDLATIGKYAEPDIGFREMGIAVPSMNCTFVDWRVKQDERVHFGDPIADVECPSGDDGGRRLSGPISIPSPGTGWISYMADLKPKEDIGSQSVGPNIAKVNLGWPWWLTLLAAICCLCCCFACLFKVMQKKPDYKPMPAPAPEPEPAKAPPPPEGLRLDFDDQGTIRTVYAKYRPLGIHHNYQAPIVVSSFTCNSYSKQALGVKEGWKLTRIGDKELNENKNFEQVNDQLADHMKNFPIWPLPLEFRKNPEDTETHVYKFVERPLGMEFTNTAPIRVDKVHEGSPAAQQKVDVGWFLTKIGDYDVHEKTNFREVLKYFKEGVQGLQDEGHKYTS